MRQPSINSHSLLPTPRAKPLLAVNALPSASDVISIRATYAATEDELASFGCRSGGTNFLPLGDVLSLFPHGSLPSIAFEHRGRRWQVHSQPSPHLRTGIVHLALLDEDSIMSSPRDFWQQHQEQQAHQYQHTQQQQHQQQRHQQQHQHEHGGSPAPSSSTDTAGGSNSSSAAGSPDSEPGARCFPQQQQQQHHKGYSGANGGPPWSSARAAPFGRGIALLDTFARANQSAEPLDRYRSIKQLIKYCQRQMAAVHEPYVPSSWAAPPAPTLLQEILRVGDTLAAFGNTEHPQSTNSSRAILARDYAKLLQDYLSSLGHVLQEAFYDQLPEELQVHAMTVSSLLETRCEANALIFDQLIAHVGLEGQNRGSNVHVFTTNVSNTSSAPVSNVTASPVNTVSATSTSKSKAKTVAAGLGAMLAVAAVVVAGAVLGKAHLGRRRGEGSDGEGGRRRGKQKLLLHAWRFKLFWMDD